MKKNLKQICLIFILLSLSVYLVVSLSNVKENKPLEIVEISVIMKSEDFPGLNIVKQGIIQASEDLNIEIRFLFPERNNSSFAQKKLISKEIENGADGILICAVNEEEMADFLMQESKKVTIVTFESPDMEKAVATNISCNDEQMGIALADEIFANASGREIILLETADSSKNIKIREQTIEDVLQKRGCKVTRYVLPQDEEAAQTALVSFIGNRNNIIIAADSYSFHLAIDASSKYDYENIYGIGSGEQVASAIENQKAKAAIVENNFAMGYLAVKSCYDHIIGSPQNNPIELEFKLVTKENMFDHEVEKIMFPLIK